MLRWLAPRSRKAVQRGANRLLEKAEAVGMFPRLPAFERDYGREYPELKRLERGYPAIREECLRLLDIKTRLTDVETLGGDYTDGGIHRIAWKAFMLKSGRFLPSNCRLAPRTAALLEDIPGLYTAFFSVLDPGQYITPHWGYWKGFLRYHLGVLIPQNNHHGGCWLRIHSDPADNAARDVRYIERGQKYHWREGEGVLFDDTFLHDAFNGTDDTRVVLWLDVRRRMPAYLQALNTTFLEIAHRDPAVAQVRRNATLPDPGRPAPP